MYHFDIVEIWINVQAVCGWVPKGIGSYQIFVQGLLSTISWTVEQKLLYEILSLLKLYKNTSSFALFRVQQTEITY